MIDFLTKKREKDQDVTLYPRCIIGFYQCAIKAFKVVRRKTASITKNKQVA